MGVILVILVNFQKQAVTSLTVKLNELSDNLVLIHKEEAT